MSLSCNCDYDYDYEAGDWYYDFNQYNTTLDFSPLKSKRAKRCCSCNSLIKVGDLCIEYSRVRYPYDDVEARIKSGYEDLEESLCNEANIGIAPHYHCERCGEIWLNLTDIGYECLSPSENMEESLKEYWELTGFKPANQLVQPVPLGIG